MLTRSAFFQASSSSLSAKRKSLSTISRSSCFVFGVSVTTTTNTSTVQFLKPTLSFLAPSRTVHNTGEKSTQKQQTSAMSRRERTEDSDVEEVVAAVAETKTTATTTTTKTIKAPAATSKAAKVMVQPALNFGGAKKNNTTGDGAAAAADTGINLKQYLTEPEWTAALAPTFASATMTGINNQIAADAKKKAQVFPPRDQIFAALNVCPLSKVKVVLIGQDPYHDVGQANGLCFSVQRGVKIPPSLANMYKELATDIPGFKHPGHGNLMCWAQQGVLMLNATLTVRAHEANSHEKCGWQDFTDAIIDKVNARKEPAVFMLWGNFAKKKGARVDRKKHRVVENAHPSPLSFKQWEGCKPFSKCNDALVALGLEPINWMVPA